MTNVIDGTTFRPQPIRVLIGQEDIAIDSLDGAIRFIRSLRHDRLGRFAEMLLTQMEAARLPPSAERCLGRLRHLDRCLPSAQ